MEQPLCHHTERTRLCQRKCHLTSRRHQPPLALAVPLSRFTSRVGGGSAFYVRCRSRIAMKSNTQRLYVVVRHKRDPDQSFVNSWLDDERLEAITTTPEIGRFCLDAQQGGEAVCVHRCGWADVRPTVCCSVSVVRVDSVDKRTSLVSFGDQQVLDISPPVTPHPGQCFYFAEPCC